MLGRFEFMQHEPYRVKHFRQDFQAVWGRQHAEQRTLVAAAAQDFSAVLGQDKGRVGAFVR
jgi:hypothetical protein